MAVFATSPLASFILLLGAGTPSFAQVVDTVSPSVKITAPASPLTATFDITGTVKENLGLTSFTVKLNGVTQTLDTPVTLGAPLNSVLWKVTGALAENGPNTIIVEAIDGAGRIGTTSKTVTYTNTRPALVGTYSALLKPSGTATNDVSGLVTVTVAAAGTFTGKVSLGGTSVSFSGYLKNDGAARFKPTLATSYDLVNTKDYDSFLGALSLSVADPAGLSGSLLPEAGSGSPLGTFAGLKTVTSAPAALLNLTTKGSYTVKFPSQSQVGLTSERYPQGDGVGTVTISSSGSVSLSGSLADGTAISAGGKLTSDSSIPLLAMLYKKDGSFATKLQFDTDSAAHGNSDVLGDDSLWIRPAQPRGRYYPLGWPAGILIDVTGAKYDKTRLPNVVPGVTADGLTTGGNAIVTFKQGKLSADVPVTLNIGVLSPNKVTILPPNPSFTFSLNAGAGLFSGKLPHTDLTTPTYKGVILQKGSSVGGTGYFLSTPTLIYVSDAASGSVTLAPKP